MKKVLAGAGMATILLTGAGVASAQSEPDDTTTDEPSDQGARPVDEGHAHPPSLPGELAERLGLDRQELRAELEAGRTMAEIAEEQGLDVGELIGEIVDEATARAAEHPDSRFAEHFDADRLTERLTELADGTFEPGDGTGGPGPGRGPGGHGHRGGPGGGAVRGLVDALGLDREELRAELEAGRTLAEIADERDVDLDAAIESLVDDMEARAADRPASRLAEEFDRDEATRRLGELAERQLDPSSDGPGRHGDRHDAGEDDGAGDDADRGDGSGGSSGSGTSTTTIEPATSTASTET